MILLYRAKAKFENLQWTLIGKLLKPRSKLSVGHLNNQFIVLGVDVGDNTFTQVDFKFTFVYFIA